MMPSSTGADPEVEWLDESFRGCCPACAWKGPERIHLWDARIDSARHVGEHLRELARQPRFN